MDEKMIRLAVDLANGKVQQYGASTEEANEVLRKAFCELMELSEDGKMDFKTFRRNKVRVFEILEEILEETINEGLQDQFDKFVEYRNLKWGDTNKFIVPDNEIFRVATVADGNGNIRRQRLRDGEEFYVPVETIAVKIYEEFHCFLAGRMDWASMISKVGTSFQRDLTEKIFNAVMSSYTKYNSTYHFVLSGSSAQEKETKLIETAMHIQARTGEKVNIYGTKLALRKLTPSVSTENLNNLYHQLGYYGSIAGMNMFEIEQAHKYGTDEFVIDNDFILLLPENPDKMVKIVNEGEAIIQETNGGETADMAMEYFIAQKFGVSVITSKAFGFIKLA